jgi:hypothetical protein
MFSKRADMTAMNRLFLRNALLLAAFVSMVLIPAGCGPALSGKYETPGGVLSLEFRSGKAIIGNEFGKTESEYEVQGDTIVLKQTGLTLTRNPDGTISYILGTFSKVKK